MHTVDTICPFCGVGCGLRLHPPMSAIQPFNEA